MLYIEKVLLVNKNYMLHLVKYNETHESLTSIQVLASASSAGDKIVLTYSDTTSYSKDIAIGVSSDFHIHTITTLLPIDYVSNIMLQVKYMFYRQ